MPDERSQVSENAEGEHVHSAEAGRDPDHALRPGNTSGSGDVERAQRRAALPPDAPIKGGPSREPTANQPQPGLEHGDTPAGTAAPPPTGARSEDAGDPTPGLDQTTVEHTAPGPSEPQGASKEQLGRIQERNRALIDDDAEPGAEGERETGVGKSVKSVPSQTGDYASD